MISNPETSIALPEDLQQKLENARNNVTMLETETTRLQKLIGQQNASIAAIHAERKDLDEQVAAVKATLDALLTETASRKIDWAALQATLSAAKASLAETKLEDERVKSEQTSRSRHLDLREAAVQATEQSVNERQIALLQRESEHGAKVEKLKRALA